MRSEQQRETGMAEEHKCRICTAIDRGDPVTDDQREALHLTVRDVLFAEDAHTAFGCEAMKPGSLLDDVMSELVHRSDLLLFTLGFDDAEVEALRERAENIAHKVRCAKTHLH
jgi:hypothetical protein